MKRSAPRAVLALVVGAVLLAPATGLAAGDLRRQLGRNETRIYAGSYRIEPGRTVAELALDRRLERRGYRRVRGRRPDAPGQYFYGNEKFWIYRPAVRLGRERHESRLIGLRLRPSDGTILSGMSDSEGPLAERHLWLEPELIAESFDADRALTEWVRYDDLPEILWRSVLAAEDARFFDHAGVDARALARAMLSNAKAGRVVQGGSTITQQLVKMRDLSPERSLGRKASEAVRALALEADHDKAEILEAYLNAVYFGHLDGVQLYGVGTAARAYFSKRATDLDLAESALLAAMIQGPNRLSPVRNPEAVLPRYRWVLSRLAELDWAPASRTRAAGERLPKLRPSPPKVPGSRHFLDWIESDVEARAPRLTRDERGVVVFTTLDPLIQEAAESAVDRGLRRLASSRRGLASQPLSAALVALDGRSGDVLGWVGGDPSDRSDAFDRGRRARRQPGSTVKPLVLLEAFQDCGRRRSLYPARSVSDHALTLDLPSGPWSPVDPDGRFREAVSVRTATVQSLNIPFVRMGRWCGFDAVAERMRRAGLDLPQDPGPAFVLGSVETTPLDLAVAYTTLVGRGKRSRARPWTRMLLPSGASLARREVSRRRVASPATAYLVRDLLEDALRRGTASTGAFGDEGVFARTGAFGKTGTSSGGRDAWFAGGAGSIVAVVWVGLDEGDLGLSGTSAAAPIWREFMDAAVPLRPAADTTRPRAVVERWVQVETGLLTSRQRDGSVLELFRDGQTPPKRRFWRRDEPLAPIE